MENCSPAWARSIQLRSEIAAAMRLGLEWRERRRRNPRLPHSSPSGAPMHSDGHDSSTGSAVRSSSAEPAERRLRILLISDHDSLRSSRDLLLRKQGFEVCSISSDEFMFAPPMLEFEVAILCQSLEREPALFLSGMLRRIYAGIFLIRVLNLCPIRVHGFDLVLDGLEGPTGLLKALRSLSSKLIR